MYIDNYKSCAETFVTLRIYHDEITPEFITELLNLTPTTIQIKGDKLGIRSVITSNGWFFSSSEKISSRDTRRHIDYLLDIILPAKDKINLLIREDAKISLSCYWLSKACNGGPTLSQVQMSKLSELGIDFEFDFYCID